MEFINTTGNTVYLEDIDQSVFYYDGDVQYIDIDYVKKSKNFRRMIQLNKFILKQLGNSLFEKNLIRLQESGKEMSISKKEKEEQIEVKSTSDQIEVKLRGHMYEAGGYAKVNRNLAIGLSSLKVKVNIEAVSQAINDLNELEIKQLNQVNCPVGRNAIIIDSMVPTFSSQGFGKYRILYTTIEANTIPQQFVDIAKNYNEIWVTSNFCKDVLQKELPNKEILILPDSVNTSLYTSEASPKEFRPAMNDFVFLSIFGWGYRKGYDLLLKSYLEEFNSNDPVSLLIFSRYQSRSKRSNIVQKTINEFIKKYGGKNPPHIARCNKVIPEYEMPSVYRAANAFISCSRGEGFCLPLVEASLCGLPVISINHSGPTMFLNYENSTLIEPDKLEKIRPGTMKIHYWDNQEFPSLTSQSVIDDTKKAMRNVYLNYQDAIDKNKILMSFLSKNYNIQTVATNAKKRLKEIWSKIC